MHMDLLCIICCDLSTHSRELMWYIYPYPSGLFHRHGSNHTIDPSHKSHNALNKYPTMHHFVTEMCRHLHIFVTKWCIVGHGIGALWDLCNRSLAPVPVKCPEKELCHSGWLYLGQISPSGLQSWNVCHVDFCWNCNKAFLNSWILKNMATIICYLTTTKQYA